MFYYEHGAKVTKIGSNWIAASEDYLLTSLKSEYLYLAVGQLVLGFRYRSKVCLKEVKEIISLTLFLQQSSNLVQLPLCLTSSSILPKQKLLSREVSSGKLLVLLFVQNVLG